MSSYEQRDNSGSVFMNHRKERDTHPDRSGQAMIDGKMYWVSGWIKQKQNGEHWLSLAFKAMTPDQAAKYLPNGSSSTAPVTSLAGGDDEVPF